VSNGAGATAAITVTPLFAAGLTNTVTGTCDGTDSNAANNTATVVTTVLGAGVLTVSPVTDLVATGALHGPFNPGAQVYALTNVGTAPLVWQATNAMNWVNLSSTGGTLNVMSGTTVTVSIGGNASDLSTGVWADVVAFINLTAGTGSATRNVQLTVIPVGPLDHFAWSGVGGRTDATLPSRLASRPRMPAATRCRRLPTRSAFRMAGNVRADPVPRGQRTTAWFYPMCTSYHDSRTQVIYPANAFGGPCMITSMALNVTTVPGQVMSNWTIRLKHTALTNYAGLARMGNGLDDGVSGE